MHIGIVTETYPPEVNGVALTVACLAESLRDLGHQIRVIRPRRSDLGPTPEGIRVTTVPGAPLPCYPELRFGLPVVKRLMALWRNQRPDALYLATEGPLGWAALKAAKRLDIPALSSYHTHFDAYTTHYRLGFAQPMVTRYLRGFHNATQATLVATSELRDNLKQIGYNNPVVLPRGVDTRQFNPQKRSAALRKQWGADETTPVVITVGRIAPEKNLTLAARAFEAFKAEAPAAKYVWVGDGPSRSVFQNQHPNYLFTGTLRGESLADHYASADVFLFPSLTETYGNVTLEALASGLAVVAFDYGAARELVRSGKNGCLAPRGDERAFIGQLRKLGQRLEKLEVLRESARSAIDKLDQQTMARAFILQLQLQDPGGTLVA